jgi:hypothetical protein
MHRPEPAYTEQSQARLRACPTKGGAVRIRIALATAVAVIMSIPVFVFAFLDGTPTASAGAARHQAVGQRHDAASSQAVRINDKLTSWSQARAASKMVAYADAVKASQMATFFQHLAFFQAVAAWQKAHPPVETIPAAWMPTAICEEGGRNDPYAGYFGILAWGNFDGYPTAGSAPLSVQLAWEAAHGQGPPDAPGQCHSY